MSSLQKLGFNIQKNIFSDTQLVSFRKEADRISTIQHSACVRHLRDKSTLFSELANSDTLLSLLPENYIPVRSILFDKTPKQNWPVAWHQDLTITVNKQIDIADYGPWSTKDGSTHVQPPVSILEQMLTIRIHLDHTPATNGALRVIPKSHLLGKIPSSEVKKHTCGSTSSSQAHTCACEAGDILLMSPLILHASSRSEKPKRRRIIHFEYAPSNALHNELSWFEG